MKKYLVFMGIIFCGLTICLTGDSALAIELEASTQSETTASSVATIQSTETESSSPENSANQSATTFAPIESSTTEEEASNKKSTDSNLSESTVIKSDTVLPIGILVKLNTSLSVEQIQGNVNRHGATIYNFELLETPITNTVGVHTVLARYDWHSVIDVTRYEAPLSYRVVQNQPNYEIVFLSKDSASNSAVFQLKSATGLSVSNIKIYRQIDHANLEPDSTFGDMATTDSEGYFTIYLSQYETFFSALDETTGEYSLIYSAEVLIANTTVSTTTSSDPLTTQKDEIVTTTDNKENKQSLPQTGEQNQVFLVFLGALFIVIFFGLKTVYSVKQRS